MTTERQSTQQATGSAPVHSIPQVRMEGLPDLTNPNPEPRTLAVLDAAITQELTAALTDDKARIEHYRNAGKLYKEAKDRAASEGTTFEDWFGSKDRGHSIRTAFHWMALDKYWGLVAPMLRELTPGSEANYKALVKKAKAMIRERAGRPAPKPREKWKPQLGKVKARLLELKKKHHNFKSAQDIFNFLKDVGLPVKSWKELEQ